MEIKTQLEYKNDNERMDFIVENNHKKGYDIRYSTRIETVEKTREVPEFDIVDGVEVPVMIEETYTQTVPKYDDDGNYIEDEEVEAVREVQKTHTETYSEDVTINIIEARGYTEEELEEQNRERVSALSCTKRNFALMLEELGITYDQLKELIATNSRAQLEWDLCERLEHSNPLLDTMAAQLNITPEILDRMFLFANGEVDTLI